MSLVTDTIRNIRRNRFYILPLSLPGPMDKTANTSSSVVQEISAPAKATIGTSIQFVPYVNDLDFFATLYIM